jgi:hypothetical protein
MFLFSGCEEDGNRTENPLTGTSARIIDKAEVGGAARTRALVWVGFNPYGYVDASIGGKKLFKTEFLTNEQVNYAKKHLVCDVTLTGGSSANIICGWTWYEKYSGVLRGALAGEWDWTYLTPISTSDTLEIKVTLSDRKESVMYLYIDASGYLY